MQRFDLSFDLKTTLLRCYIKLFIIDSLPNTSFLLNLIKQNIFVVVWVCITANGGLCKELQRGIFNQVGSGFPACAIRILTVKTTGV